MYFSPPFFIYMQNKNSSNHINLIIYIYIIIVKYVIKFFCSDSWRFRIGIALVFFSLKT
jgi:hypothetical protein